MPASRPRYLGGAISEMYMGATTVEMPIPRPPMTRARMKTETFGAKAEPTARTAKEPSALRLELELRGVCWISATADEKRVVYRLMQGGERQTFEARDGLILVSAIPRRSRFLSTERQADRLAARVNR